MWEEDLGFKVILSKQSPGSVWAIRVPISNRNGFLLIRNHTVIRSVYHWAYRCPACAIIQRFSLHGKTGGYNPSESGSPGALQEHGGGGGMSVWSAGGSRSLIRSAAALLGPKTSLLEIRLFLMACLVCGYRCQKCCLCGLLAQ